MYPHFVEQRIRDTLADTRVVLKAWCMDRAVVLRRWVT